MEGDPPTVARRVAVKDHLAQRLEVHPSQIAIVEETDTTATGVSAAHPRRRFPVQVDRDDPLSFVVTGGESERAK